MIRLYHQEALNFVKSCGQYDCIFMDPPDNVGLGYAGVKDKRDDYYKWLEDLILESMGKAPIVWISYYWRHDVPLKASLAWILRHSDWEAKTFIWRFTFGQYNDKDCGSGYRPILRLSRPRVEWSVDAIRIQSERMRLGDSRACGPKVPDDVWEFPRVVGNSVERREWIPTQHPEALMKRIYLLSGGTKILELFAGSGTGIRVAKRLGFDLDTVELSGDYIKRLRAEHPDIEIGRESI